MDTKTSAQKVLEEMRDVHRLKHLKLRPRTLDGSLDLRCKANRGFAKAEKVTDYYEPDNPQLNVPSETIKRLQDHLIKEYDRLRFQELEKEKQQQEKELKWRRARATEEREAILKFVKTMAEIKSKYERIRASE